MPIVTIPVAVLLAFIPMSWLGISSNIMSLAGIAISIGVLVDGAIVEVENAYKKLELWQSDGGRKGDFHEVRLEALLEVGPSVFFSLLVIAVAFLPIFTLVDQEGPALPAAGLDQEPHDVHRGAPRAHARPGAAHDVHADGLGRTSGRAGSSWIWNQVTVGRYYPEEKHPISRVLFAVYEPACRLVLRHPRATIAAAVARRGHDRSRLPRRSATSSCPRSNEGTILYMPTTLPGISVAEASRWLQVQDRSCSRFPRWSRSSARRGAPRRRPIRRRSR